jgi:hypothetical protein
MQNPNNNPIQNQNPKTLTWETLEHAEHKKHPLWFIGLAVIMSLVVLYAFNTGSWSMAIVFILITVLLLYFGSQKPKLIKVQAGTTGITIGTITYEYKIIKKFWIVYYPPQVKVLYLETGAYLNNLVRIELGNQDPVAVKKFLLQYLEEDLDGQESLVDIIARRLKF